MRSDLLRWYDDNARDLPWRRTRDPYAIWVSEVMLQQTRVETVVPYYERFLARFPTPEDLAGATDDEVMASWSGLGYYRRARLLVAGVREVVEKYGGRVPEDADARRALPGVGRYTAGAIGSIAFDLPEPIVDGNVARVLSRVHRIDAPLGSKPSELKLWDAARELVRGERPGALNQALMELGATTCTPKTPRCDACPIARACGARADGRVAELPVPRPKKAPVPVSLVAVLAERGTPKRTFLVRGEGTLFGGLFGLPMAEGEGRDAARAALREAKVSARLADAPCARLEHVLTHRRLDVRVYRATHARAEQTDALRALLDAELETVGVATLTKRLIAAASRPEAAQRDLFTE
jgi:A/G-specific adenine glycosylase